MEKYILNYHKKIWRKAKSTTYNYYMSNISDWGSDIIGVILTALASALYFSFKSNNNLDLWGALISIGVGFVGVLVFRFLYNLIWEIPAKLHRENEIEANKYTWKDVSITPINSNYSEAKIAGFVVINNKPFDIKNAHVKTTTMREENNYFTSLNSPLSFAWNSGDGVIRGGKFIEKQNEKNPEFIPVSNRIVENEKALLLAQNLDDEIQGKSKFPELKQNINYVISVSFTGEVEDRKMDDLTKLYKIKVVGSDILFSEA